MMKVSDPILFGHMVRQFYKDVFEKHQQLFTKLGVNPNNGIGDLYEKIKGNPAQAEVEEDIFKCYADRPGLAMVDYSKGGPLIVSARENISCNNSAQGSPTSTSPATSSLTPACRAL